MSANSYKQYHLFRFFKDSSVISSYIYTATICIGFVYGMIVEKRMIFMFLKKLEPHVKFIPDLAWGPA
jgi:hypothetical protein